jgi:putative tryptophan/tyrosine transport system substrate-binding protein
VVRRPLTVRAQQAAKMRTIGYLSPGAAPGITALFDALPELGWIEGKNIAFERRWAENRLERLPELAAELVRLNVDVIVAVGTLAPLAAKRATSTIPIVMTAAGDPLGSGLVASLAHPEIGRQGRQSIVLTLRPPVFDQHVLTFDIARLLEALTERSHHGPVPVS